METNETEMRAERDDEKASALADFLECSVEEIGDAPVGFDENRYDAWGREYLVLTDEEADAAMQECVRESLWAFNPCFLERYTPEGVEAEEIRLIIGDRCEDANGAMLALVGDRFEELVTDAGNEDGRGHFLAGYDGEENEESVFYIYRTN